MKLTPFINQILLREGKRDEREIVQKYKIDAYYYEMIRRLDPSPTKKYTKYILLMFGKGKMNSAEVGDAQSFILNSKKLRQFYEMNAKYDFSAFKTWDEFKKYMEPYVDWVGKRELKLVASDPSAMTIVHDNDKCFIVKLKKKEAACVYGTGTHWCVSQKDQDYFQHYNSSQILYEIISRIYKKHAENPLLFKLMLLVPRSNGNRIQLVAADNTHHNIEIQDGKCIITAGTHKDKLQEYIDKLDINWNDLIFDNIKNFDVRSAVNADNSLNLTNEFVSYMAYKGYTDLTFLNTPELHLRSNQIGHLKLNSLKGIGLISFDENVNFLQFSNDALNEYIPKLKPYGSYAYIQVSHTITDLSFLVNVPPIPELIIKSAEMMKINKLPMPDEISQSKFRVIHLPKCMVSDSIDLSLYPNVKCGTLFKLSDDETELNVKYSQNNGVALHTFNEFTKLKTINFSFTTPQGVFQLNGSYVTSKDLEINFEDDMSVVRIEEFVPKSLNKASKKSISELRLSENGIRDRTMELYAPVKKMVLHYCHGIKFIADKLQMISIVHASPDLSEVNIVDDIWLEGDTPSIEYPKHTKKLNFSYVDQLPKFKLKDFTIDSVSYRGYDKQYLFDYLKTFNFIPSEIDPKLTDEQMKWLKANVGPVKIDPPKISTKKKIPKTLYKAGEYDYNDEPVGPELAKKMKRRVVKKPKPGNNDV